MIPDMQQNNATNNGNAQQGTTQTDNNSFMIEPEPQTDQPATQDSQGFEISTDVYDTNANGNAAGSQTQQGNAQTDVMTDAVELQSSPNSRNRLSSLCLPFRRKRSRQPTIPTS